MRRGILAAVGIKPQRADSFEYTLDCLAWMGRADSELVRSVFQELTTADWERGFKNGRRLGSLLTKKYDEEMAGVPGGGVFGKVKGHQFIANLHVRFFLKVAFPCWFLYGKWPSRMLSEATRRAKPNWKMLENLVRLDKCVVHHRRVVWLLSDAPKRIRQLARGRVSKGINKHPRRLSRKTVKYQIARLLSRISERFGCRMKEPEIRELFNATNSIQQGALVDPDMPVSSEALSKAIQREPLFWSLLPKPDTKILEAVRALREKLV
ncbi:MAG: hypothetical protein GXP26_02515 [Planctomycetes bacterium]|nr:hypothetical protein [Planctomycetota bacterium]